jgi:DNA helicase-4
MSGVTETGVNEKLNFIQRTNKLYTAIHNLFDNWQYWDVYEEFYLNTLLPDLVADEQKRERPDKALFKNIEAVATAEEWGSLVQIGYWVRKYKGTKEFDFTLALKAYNFDQADVLYENVRDKYPESLYLKLKEAYEVKAEIDYKANQLGIITAELNTFNFQKAQNTFESISHLLNEEEKKHFHLGYEKQLEFYKVKSLKQIKKALNDYQFELAESLYEKIHPFIPSDEYQALKVHCEEKYQAEEKLKQIRGEIASHLNKFLFQDADRLFMKHQKFFSIEGYEKYKSRFVKHYINQNYSKALGYDISLEQSLAISKLNMNLLLKARAGSGKTTVIACKTAMLLKKYLVHPDEILILSFNKKAAQEISNRIRYKFGHANFNNARTFHSLAYQLVQPKSILFDEDTDPNTQYLKQFIKNLMTEKLTETAFQKKLYDSFRSELIEIERFGDQLSKEDYYIFRRNLSYITLSGKKVRSLAEKYIADFLFEHGIYFDYEKPYYWDKSIYRPDFSLFENSQNYVLEHWGIYLNDSQRRAPGDRKKTYEEYYQEILRKRRYWAAQEIPLIETSQSDLISGRESFESILKQNLEEVGITCNLLPLEERVEKVKNYHINRMTELFTQFIQKAQKKELSPEDIKKRIETETQQNEKVQDFLELANCIYREYLQELQKTEKIDFDQLMSRAIDVIEESQGECSIRIDNRRVKLNSLHWILIDEYQDFSQLFYRLIATLKKYNPQVQLFCVGDDWQAINGFAGSELKYFNDFNTLFEDAGDANLLINTRCKEVILNASNNLMKDLVDPAIPLESNKGGNIQIDFLDDFRVEYNHEDPASSPDYNFLFLNSITKKLNDFGFIKAKCLKKCYEIISHDLSKKYAILSRTREPYDIKFDEFRNRLINCFDPLQKRKIGDFSEKIHIDTAHSYKGREADVVILLNVCNGSFPILHPDHILFTIFGQTTLDILEEERRLFYVALTRAKEKLYILTEKENESEFLESLV